VSAHGRAGRNQLLLLIGLMFVTPFVFTGVETTLALWTANELEWGAQQNGVLYTYMGLVAVVVQGLLVGPLVGRLGERRTVALGAAGAALGAFCLPFAGGFAVLMLGLGLIVFGVSVSGPSLNSLVAGYAPSDARGAVMGVAHGSSGLGRVVGPASAGLGFERIGHDWPAFSGAAAMLAMSLAARALIRARGT
jgi:DHA1 family tetracycline resistance protein-like MFS transporter